jgi:tetratricopeptide (TPR) repeat protein
LINKVLANEGDFEDQEKAAEHSRLAKELDPNLLEVHRARGLVLLAFGSENLPEAVSELKAAIAINDKIADLHYNLGYAYKVMEESDLAVEELLYAYTLNPKDGAPLIEAASVYARMASSVGCPARRAGGQDRSGERTLARFPWCNVLPE